jgi:hypothetical protein
VHELVARALELILTVGEALVELAIGVLDGLLEQAVLGLEVVEDRRRARARALGDVPDPRVKEPSLVEDLGCCGDDLRFAQVIDFGAGAHLSSNCSTGIPRACILNSRSENYQQGSRCQARNE